jgi:pimeloyl-ACP methyl ester carboxylesterase
MAQRSGRNLNSEFGLRSVLKIFLRHGDFMKRAIAVLVLILICGSLGLARTYPPTVPRFETAPCVFRLSSELAKLKKRCGFVVVLERHGLSRGRAIRLFVMVLQRGVQKSQNALIYLNGGPGASSAFLGTALTGELASVFTAKEDLILFDQRGIGFSQPALNCGGDMVLCRELYTRAGFEISAFNSVENALDVGDIRDQLGYEKLDVYGISYGTLLAQHVMRLNAHVVRSVTLDAVLPVGVNALVDNIATKDRALRRVLEACETDLRCEKAFPNLYFQLEQAFKNVRNEPVVVRIRGGERNGGFDLKLNEYMVYGFLIANLYDSDANLRIPLFIHSLAARDSRTLEQILSPYFAIENVLIEVDAFAQGMYLSVVCREMVSLNPTEWATTLGFDVLPIYRELSTKPSSGVVKSCKDWKPGIASATDLEPVVSRIPTLIFTGKFDPVTPSEYARAVASHLEQSQVVEFTGGHGVLNKNANLSCANKLFQAFLEQPEQKLETSCSNRAIYWAGVPDDQPPASRPNVR